MTSVVRPEPKRIRQLRAQIVKEIPKFPNDWHTVADLEAKPLADLLIAYANWAYRFVPPRPRRVAIEPTLTRDPRWKELGPAVRRLLNRVRAGDDLASHLSLETRRHGYTPSKSTAVRSDKWQDKDAVLITMGYHHFHLGEHGPDDGVVAVDRSDLRWCSDGFEIKCDSGETVTTTFAKDCCDREVMAWRAWEGKGLPGEPVREMLVEAVERRFGGVIRALQRGAFALVVENAFPQGVQAAASRAGPARRPGAKLRLERVREYGGKITRRTLEEWADLFMNSHVHERKRSVVPASQDSDSDVDSKSSAPRRDTYSTNSEASSAADFSGPM